MASPKYWVVERDGKVIVPFAKSRELAIMMAYNPLYAMPQEVMFEFIDLHRTVAGWSELTFRDWKVSPVFQKQGPYRDKTPSQ